MSLNQILNDIAPENVSQMFVPYKCSTAQVTKRIKSELDKESRGFQWSFLI